MTVTTDPFAWCSHLRARARYDGPENSYRLRGLHTDERIGWLLDRAADRWPDKEALVFEGERLSFSDLNEWTLAVAADLVDSGVGPGAKLLWQLPNCVEGLVLHLAAWRIGAVCVPVVPLYRTHEMRSILRQVAPDVVAFGADGPTRRPTDEADELMAELGIEPQLRLTVGDARGPWRRVREREEVVAAPDVELPDPAPADEPSLVLFTSGTTSEPKGAVHAGRALLAEAATWRDAIGLHGGDTFLMGAPITHIAGLLTAVVVPAVLGARTVLMSAWDADEAIRLAAAENATISAGATIFLQAFVERYEADCVDHRLRGFLAGGAAVPAEMVRRAEAVGIKAFRSWGMTELPTATLVSLTDDLERRATTDGRLTEGIECQAVDADRQPLPPGTEGELRLRGPEQMLGYLNSDVDAAQTDDEDWFYTGDVGRVDADGWVTMSGRVKDIVNRGGEKFSAQDIENALASHPSVVAAAVVGTAEPRLGEQVTAFLVLRPGEEWPGPEALIAHLEELGLARQKYPVAWRLLDELPMTLSGKIQKHVLLDRWTKELETMGDPK